MDFIKKRLKIKEYEKKEILFGTVCYIKVFGENSKKAVIKSFKELRNLHNQFSLFDKKSEINKLNSSDEKEIICSKDMLEIIKNSLEYSKITNGNFDITSQKLIEFWGIGKENFKIRNKGDIDNIKKYINYKNIFLDEENFKVKLGKMQNITLAGIAKGFATDQIVKILVSYNIKNAIINLGGNVYAMGYKEDKNVWNVGIQNPLKSTGQYMGVIGVSNKSIVTSGSYERFSVYNDILYSHIIDLKSGYPVSNEMLSITIISNKSIDGDGLSTGLFIMGLEKALKIIESLNDIECVCILKSGKVVLSSGLIGYFKIIDNKFYL